MPNLNQIVDDLSTLTVMEAAQLAKMLEDKWGVSAAAPVAAVQAGPAMATEPVEEKTDFEAILVSYGEKKMEVVKVVRPLAGLGLKDVLAYMNDLPKPIKSGIPKDQADKIKTEVEAVGGTVEIR